MATSLWRVLLAALPLCWACSEAKDRHQGNGGGDEDSISPLLVGQFRADYAHAAPTALTYQTASGATVTQRVFAREVVVLTEPGTSSDALHDVTRAAHATALAALPRAGFYLFHSAEGGESALIAALANVGVVRAVFPNPVLSSEQAHPTCGPAGVTDVSGQAQGPHTCADGTREGRTELVAVDLYKNEDISGEPCVSHGAQVSCMLTDPSYDGGPACGLDVDLGTTGGGLNGGITSLLEVQWAIAGALAGAHARGNFAVINASIGPARDPGCDPPCYVDQYEHWLMGYAGIVTAARDALGPNFMLVLAAGNEGINVTGVVDRVKQAYPDAFENMVLVGSTNASNNRAEFSNFSLGVDDMIYANGDNPCCDEVCASGTSFAAPQVATTIADAVATFHEDNDALPTGAAVVDALLSAAPLVNTMRLRPDPEALLAELEEHVVDNDSGTDGGDPDQGDSGPAPGDYDYGDPGPGPGDLDTGGDSGDTLCCCYFGLDQYWHCVHGQSSEPGALCYIPWPECCDQPYTLCQ